MVFSERLEQLLKERKVTWKEVSKELGIGKNQQKYWADKDNAPDGKTLIKLAQYFEVTTDYLLGIIDLKKQALNIMDNQTLTLTVEEVNLILKYRSLDTEGQTMVDSAVITETRRMANKSEESNVG